MKKTFYKYWQWCAFALIIIIFLLTLLLSRWMTYYTANRYFFNEGILSKQEYINSFINNTLSLITYSVFPGTIFLAIYYGVKYNKLSKVSNYNSVEEYEKVIKEKRLKKLEKQKAELQKRIDAETNKE